MSAFRKHESDYKKRLKKQKIEDLTLSQKGDMDNFFIKKPQVSSDNQSLDREHAPDNNVDNDPSPRDGVTMIFCAIEKDIMCMHDSNFLSVFLYDSYLLNKNLALNSFIHLKSR